MQVGRLPTIALPKISIVVLSVIEVTGAMLTRRWQSWVAAVGQHKRLQRCQAWQHSRQRAVVALLHVSQRQTRQPTEPRPVLQLKILCQPVFWRIGMR